MKTLSCGLPLSAGAQMPGQWLGWGMGFSRLDQVAAFLETGLLVAKADKAGKLLPWALLGKHVDTEEELEHVNS